jgi:phosphotriesterase-related protein
MATINTAKGTVDTSELGFTLMHEHVFTRSPGVFEAWPHLWDAKAQAARAVETFRDLKAAGVDTIVDLTTVDLGRDVPIVVEIAKQVELNIVMCTGVWRNPPRYFDRRNIDPVADLFVRDIEQGMQGTSVRAAIIKLATEPEVDELNERMLRAGARAHRRTGVPISTHHYVPTQCGLRQQDVFESEGVDLSRVVIGHSGDTADVEYLERIIARAATSGWTASGRGCCSRRSSAWTRWRSCAGAATRTAWCCRTTRTCSWTPSAGAQGGAHAGLALPAHQRRHPAGLRQRGVTEEQVRR